MSVAAPSQRQHHPCVVCCGEARGAAATNDTKTGDQPGQPARRSLFRTRSMITAGRDSISALTRMTAHPAASRRAIARCPMTVDAHPPGAGHRRTRPRLSTPANPCRYVIRTTPCSACLRMRDARSSASLSTSPVLMFVAWTSASRTGIDRSGKSSRPISNAVRSGVVSRMSSTQHTSSAGSL